MGSLGKKPVLRNLWTKTCFPELADMGLFILAFIAVFVLIITGSVVMRESLASRSFEPTRCSLLRERDHGRTTCQYCYTTNTRIGSETHSRQRCVTSHFRCVALEVEYQDLDGVNHTGNLYRDALVMLEQASGQRCAHKVCGPREKSNNEAVDRFISNWQNLYPPATAQCFYNPQDRSRVITMKIHKYEDALHSVLWPTGFFFLAVFILVGRCCYRHCVAYRDHQKEVKAWEGRLQQVQ